MAPADVIPTLDHTDDEHWTDDGLPALSMFEEGTTREDVTAVAPEVTRASVKADAERDAKADPRPPDDAEEADPLEEARRAAADAAQAAIDARIARDKAEEALKQALVASSDAGALVERLTPVTSNMDTIQAYLATQNRLRHERAARAATLRAHGFRKSDMEPKSPIDAAMARKNTRGTLRPVAPQRTE